MKINQVTKNITPFGGYNFYHELFNESGLPQLINTSLGSRGDRAHYDYKGHL